MRTPKEMLTDLALTVLAVGCAAALALSSCEANATTMPPGAQAQNANATQGQTQGQGQEATANGIGSGYGAGGEAQAGGGVASMTSTESYTGPRSLYLSPGAFITPGASAYTGDSHLCRRYTQKVRPKVSVLFGFFARDAGADTTSEYDPKCAQHQAALATAYPAKTVALPQVPAAPSVNVVVDVDMEQEMRAPVVRARGKPQRRAMPDEVKASPIGCGDGRLVIVQHVDTMYRCEAVAK